MWEQCDLCCLLRFVWVCRGVVLFSPLPHLRARAAPMQPEPGDDASSRRKSKFLPFSPEDHRPPTPNDFLQYLWRARAHQPAP